MAQKHDLKHTNSLKNTPGATLLALLMSDIPFFMILLWIFQTLQQFQKCSRKGDFNGTLLF
jgi:heme/copper-type cytochrome/quinol oxidase subunit 3